MKLFLVGFGVVARAFVRLIEEQRSHLYGRYGLSPRLVGVADTRGAAISERGLEAQALFMAKERAGTVSAVPGYGLTGIAVETLIVQSDADVVVEATPTSVTSPATGLAHLKAAFRSGKHVISVNKGPLAVALPALLELSRYNRVEFRFSGTVGGGTPILALARECVRGDRIRRIRAILNGTTNFILSRMRQTTDDFDTVLAEAIRLGYAERDPSADIDGVDTATKLVILANGVLDRSVTLNDVQVSGIRGIRRGQIEEASRQGHVVKLIGEIGERLAVMPEEISIGSSLDIPANLNAVMLSLEIGGDMTLIGRGAGGPETATAVLRDLLDIWQGHRV